MITYFLIQYNDFIDKCLKTCLPSMEPFFTARKSMGKYYGDEMYKFILELDSDFKLLKIPFWNKYESTNLSYNEDFKNLICAGFQKNDIVIASMEDRIFKMKYSDYDNFIEDVYTKEYDIDFFQPTDFFFINCRLRKLILFHHSGFYGTYEESMFQI